MVIDAPAREAAWKRGLLVLVAVAFLATALVLSSLIRSELDAEARERAAGRPISGLHALPRELHR